MQKKIPLIVVFLLLVILPVNSFAGWILTGRYIDKEGNTILQRYFIQDHKVKFEQYNVIYTYNQLNGEIILVDPQNLVYYKSTLSGYISDLKACKQMQMNRLLLSVPPDEKDRVKTDLEKEVSTTGEEFPVFKDSVNIAVLPDSLRIAGLPSEKYQLTSGTRKLEDLWILPGLDVREQFSWSSYLQFLALVEPDLPALDYMRTRPFLDLLELGFPGRRIMIVSGYRTEFQLNKYEQKNIPEYEFGVPSLCREVNLSGWISRDERPSNEGDDYE